MIVENNPKYSRDTHYLPFNSYYAGEDYYKDGILLSELENT